MIIEQHSKDGIEEKTLTNTEIDARATTGDLRAKMARAHRKLTSIGMIPDAKTEAMRQALIELFAGD